MAIVSPVRAWKTTSSRTLAGNVSARVDFHELYTYVHAIYTLEKPPLSIHLPVVGEFVADRMDTRSEPTSFRPSTNRIQLDRSLTHLSYLVTVQLLHSIC